jgi:hypothetical protein
MRYPASKSPAALARRKLVTLWFGVLYAIVLYGAAMRIIPRPEAVDDAAYAGPFAIGAVFTVVLSFLVKWLLFARAREKQRPEFRRAGQIAAILVADAASLWGFALWVFTASPRSYWLLGLGFVGALLHYPAREPQQTPTDPVLP